MGASTQAIDGSLSDWQDIADTHEWEILLLGNGLSINVWDGFRYGKLFDHAHNAGLTADDLALFSGTPNFERILADLNTAIRVAEVKGVDPRLFYQSYRRIQLALGHAIRQVHPIGSRFQTGRWTPFAASLRATSGFSQRPTT